MELKPVVLSESTIKLNKTPKKLFDLNIFRQIIGSFELNFLS